MGFNQLGKKRVSSHEDRHFLVIRKKKEMEKRVKVSSFVSLPTRENSLRAGIGAILDFRGKSSHSDFSSPSRGSRINRLLLDTKRPPVK